MVPIPSLDFLGYDLFYIIGALLIILGLMPLFPNTASKIFKKEIKSKKKQKTAAVLLIIMGIGFLVCGYIA